MVLGLGNPGSEYAETRHNVAWRVLDRVAGRTRAVEGPRSMAYRSRRAEIAGRVVHLLQPLTYMNRSGEALLAWREREPDDLQRFTEVLDNTMRDLNSDYDAKRRGDMVLQRPVLHAVRIGTFHAWMKDRGRLGGQNKVPRLCNDRRHIEALLTPVVV